MTTEAPAASAYDRGYDSTQALCGHAEEPHSQLQVCLGAFWPPGHLSAWLALRVPAAKNLHMHRSGRRCWAATQ